MKAQTKANKYLRTDSVKKIKAKETEPVYGGGMLLHYDIAIGALLSFGHLLALIFYTDFTKLSSDFSTSFRAIKPFESLKNIMKRNAFYFWMSKYLRELIEIFGQCSAGDGNTRVNKMSGPF